MRGAAGRTLAAALQRCTLPAAPRAARSRSADTRGREPPKAPDPALLAVLVCPLSKKPLRYEESTNELINIELGIAYPIIDGIPNMIPQAARMIDRKAHEEEPKRT